MSQTITTAELIERLEKYPKDAQVYISRDAEGNGYSTVSDDSIEFGEIDNAIILYPVAEHLEYEDLFPKQYEKEYMEDERSVD